MQIENSNSISARRKNNDKLQCFNRNTTQDRHTAKKQPATNTPLICNNIHTKETYQNTNYQNYEPVTAQNDKLKQYYRKNNDTNDVFVVCKLNIQASHQQEGGTTTNHKFPTQTQHIT